MKLRQRSQRGLGCNQMRKMHEWKHEPITPKVLASASPGLSFGNPGTSAAMVAGTLKGFGSVVIQRYLANPFRVV